jgi:enoyl-CoA hydratase/carnithine racemase
MSGSKSDMNAADVVLLKKCGAVAQVLLNRPRAANAISAAVATRLAEITAAVETDDSIRVAVIDSTSPRYFCAGADLKEGAAGKAAGFIHPEYGLAGFVHAPRSKPWIAAVSGMALGGGFELVLACDLVVAGAQARFGLPEVKRGQFAGSGGTYRLPQRISRALAIEMILTGEPISAERALACGLVNTVVAPEQVSDTALQIAGMIAANAPLAVLESLAIARVADQLQESELRERCRLAAARIQRSNDAREGAMAFAQKRTPHWTGR